MKWQVPTQLEPIAFYISGLRHPGPSDFYINLGSISTQHKITLALDRWEFRGVFEDERTSCIVL